MRIWSLWPFRHDGDDGRRLRILVFRPGLRMVLGNCLDGEFRPCRLLALGMDQKTHEREKVVPQQQNDKRLSPTIHAWKWSAVLIGFAVGSIWGERARPAAIWLLILGTLIHAWAMQQLRKRPL